MLDRACRQNLEHVACHDETFFWKFVLIRFGTTKSARLGRKICESCRRRMAFGAPRGDYRPGVDLGTCRMAGGDGLAEGVTVGRLAEEVASGCFPGKPWVETELFVVHRPNIIPSAKKSAAMTNPARRSTAGRRSSRLNSTKAECGTSLLTSPVYFGVSDDMAAKQMPCWWSGDDKCSALVHRFYQQEMAVGADHVNESSR